MGLSWIERGEASHFIHLFLYMTVENQFLCNLKTLKEVEATSGLSSVKTAARPGVTLSKQ